MNDELPPQDEATVKQPPPFKLTYRAGDHDRSILNFIREELIPAFPNEMGVIYSDLRARRDMGKKKYGVELQTDNGRDALVDAYQEALDGLMYTAQAALETSNQGEKEALPHFETAVVMALRLASQLSMLIRIRKGEVTLRKQPEDSPSEN